MILQVLNEKHPKLRKVCKPADPALAHHRTLARRLVETMKAHKAYGIAANQVNPGELVAIVAVDVKSFTGAMFNPVIIEASEEQCALKEGCLSSKQKPIAVSRWNKIKVQFTDIAGKPMLLELEGIDAVVVQHEVDHLKGILFTDLI